MSWLDEQIKQRKCSDDELFTEAFIDIAGSVMGQKVSAALKDSRIIAKNEIDRILKFYHVKPQEIPDTIEEVNDQIEYIMRPHGIMHRTVKLSKGWSKDAFGAMLGVRSSDGHVVALLPVGITGYCFYDESGKKVKVTRKNESQFLEEALAFYKPFPLKKIGIPDLMKYMLGTINTSDIVMIVMSMLAVTGVGMLMPKINNILFCVLK